MSKLFSLHGGSLLKPPSPLKQGRHSLGIRNGGLDFVKAAVGVFRAWRLPAKRRLFSFTVVRQKHFYLLLFYKVNLTSK